MSLYSFHVVGMQQLDAYSNAPSISINIFLKFPLKTIVGGAGDNYQRNQRVIEKQKVIQNLDGCEECGERSVAAR